MAKVVKKYRVEGAHRKYRLDRSGRLVRVVDCKRRLVLPGGWKSGVMMVEEVDDFTLIVRRLVMEPGQEWIPKESKIVDEHGRLWLPSAYASETVQIEERADELVVRRVNVVAVTKVTKAGKNK